MQYNIKPTRSELIELKKKIKLAHMGHDLLKRKKDGLIQEFFKILEEVKENRGKLTENYTKARGKLSLARAMDGMQFLESVSLAMKESATIELKVKNIMGVVVPEIRAEFVEKKLEDMDYGVIGTSTYLDSLVEAYNTVLKDIIVSAELEVAMKRMLIEIEKTKRRVSALEYIVIPNMESVAKMIMLRLEEMERENIFKLKMVKAK